MMGKPASDADFPTALRPLRWSDQLYLALEANYPGLVQLTNSGIGGSASQNTNPNLDGLGRLEEAARANKRVIEVRYARSVEFPWGLAATLTVGGARFQ